MQVGRLAGFSVCQKGRSDFSRPVLPVNQGLRRDSKDGWTGQGDREKEPLTGPFVWRHWYNTLNQYMAALPPEARDRLQIQPLFNQITTAGEWYLAMPAYSAAPEVGWDLIGLLTSNERELQRVYQGVGLPTRRAFYGLNQAEEPLHLVDQGRGVATVSPFFDMDSTVLRKLVTGAFRRSQFPCYQQLTTTISAHLQRILELPEPANDKSRNKLYKDVDHIMDDLVANISFVQSNQSCPGCRTS
jgi:hypothetical protein